MQPSRKIQGKGIATLTHAPFFDSSAKDQLSGTSVAIKKIMKPFSTPVLSKRTYRELKLLKHLRHENVSLSLFQLGTIRVPLLARHIHARDC